LTGAKEHSGSENLKLSPSGLYALLRRHPMSQKEDPSRQKDDSTELISRKRSHPARGLTSQKGDPSKQKEDSTD